MEEVYLTRAGYQKLYEQMEKYKAERVKIAVVIEQARQQGDLSENAEYDAAKDQQGHNEARLADLETKLSAVRIIEDENIPGDKIYIGAIIKVKDLDSDEEMKYQMVSPAEADYETGKLSILSPVGKGLMGKAKGDEIDIEVPAGKLRYKVLSIKRP